MIPFAREFTTRLTHSTLLSTDRQVSKSSTGIRADLDSLATCLAFRIDSRKVLGKRIYVSPSLRSRSNLRTRDFVSIPRFSNKTGKVRLSGYESSTEICFGKAGVGITSASSIPCNNPHNRPPKRPPNHSTNCFSVHEVLTLPTLKLPLIEGRPFTNPSE